MSKASEWAALREAAQEANARVELHRPRFLRDGFCCEVTNHGDVEIAVGNAKFVRDPATVIAWAHWILDTFGEPSAPEARPEGETP